MIVVHTNRELGQQTDTGGGGVLEQDVSVAQGEQETGQKRQTRREAGLL